MMEDVYSDIKIDKYSFTLTQSDESVWLECQGYVIASISHEGVYIPSCCRLDEIPTDLSGKIILDEYEEPKEILYGNPNKEVVLCLTKKSQRCINVCSLDEGKPSVLFRVNIDKGIIRTYSSTYNECGIAYVDVNADTDFGKMYMIHMVM